MLIGNRYSDDKLYRGIKHYDNLPLTSGDLHEYADILQMKNAFFMNNLLGSGTLNDPILSISNTGVSLNSPSVVLIDGDISLIQSDGEILTTSEILSSNITDGYLCIVGWYQSLSTSSTLRRYGGVRNSTILNDIKDTDLNIQVSTRYQLRWDKVIISKANIEGNNNFSFTMSNRNATGSTTSGSTTITTNSRVGNILVATKPSSMTYAVSDLYIVPIIKYTYQDSAFLDTKAVRSLKPEGSIGGFLKSSSEPTGDLTDGTIWYDTSNSKFKFYVEGVGFVPTASDITLMQYRNSITITTATPDPSNIRMSMGITSYTSGDIVQVVYNGIVLTEGLHYTLHTSTGEISLLGFTTRVGDTITFIATKLVDSSTISTITSEFSSHVNTTGNLDTKGHLNLSDSMSPTLNTSSGVAATPKSVYDATTLTDTVTGIKYRLSVSNGVLGISQV